MYPYVLLDVYEGIVLKNDSTQLQGGILRGLKTCIGIVITSEKYLIILHHPAFIVDNTFQEIQNWVQLRCADFLNIMHTVRPLEGTDWPRLQCVLFCRGHLLLS